MTELKQQILSEIQSVYEYHMKEQAEIINKLEEKIMVHEITIKDMKNRQ